MKNRIKKHGLPLLFALLFIGLCIKTATSRPILSLWVGLSWVLLIVSLVIGVILLIEIILFSENRKDY